MAGGSSGSGPGGAKKARIEIIPLIDVVFFLLATFVLFTLSLNKSEGLTVILPAAATGESRDTAGTATVTIMLDGSLGWNKDQITDDEFLQRLQTYKLQTGDEGKILINGDENAMFSKARYVFDQARRAGFERIFLETRIRQGGQ
jgi:biopolymer transport protein ExbD